LPWAASLCGLTKTNRDRYDNLKFVATAAKSFLFCTLPEIDPENPQAAKAASRAGSSGAIFVTPTKQFLTELSA
jgi:hypothetical protein